MMSDILSSVTPLQIASQSRSARRSVGLWLLACCLMVAIMVMLGGITRLTNSGLSIMEWKPLMGAWPPMTDAEWQRVFALYRQISEYKHVNPDMTIDAFKGIFWWEYLHRLWGRLLAVAFLVPLVWFVIRGRITRLEIPRLVALFALGGLQGFAGWYMVASGFQDRVDVSQYRLVIHLMLALAIFSLMLWYALDYLDDTPIAGNSKASATLARHAKGMNTVIAFQIALGGLVAGTDAGFIYNDFPQMNGHWLSPDLFLMSPWWINFTENLAMVQFQHRLVSGFVAIAVISFLVRCRRHDVDPVVKRRAIIVSVALAAQAFLGISTLILVVPIPLAVLHQLGAFVLLGCGLIAQHALSRRVGSPS
jgi:cytochrome c oxidase assembly protein subunit 15